MMMRSATQSYSRKCFLALLGMILGLVFVQYAIGINVHSVFYLAASTAIACVCRKEEVLALFLCFIPLNAMLGLTYVLAICLVVYLIRFFDGIKLNLAAVCIVLLMAIWELLHYFGNSFAPIDYVVSFVPLVILVLFMSTRAERLDYAFIARCLAATTACICIALLGNMLAVTGYDVQAIFTGRERLGMSLAESTEEFVSIVHPNTLGILCSLASTVLFQLVVTGSGNRSDLTLVVLLLVFGVMTLSKTFLVCSAISAVLLFFSATGGAREKAKLIMVIVAMTIFVLLSLYFFLPEVLNFFYARFQEEDITTGRVSSMIAYHGYIVSNPHVMFFGVGLQDLYEKLVVQESIAAFVPHNGVQELVISWGVQGLLIICLLILLMLNCSRKANQKQSLINYIPLLILLVKIQAGQMMTSSYTMLAFALAYVSLCHGFEAEKVKKETSCSSGVAPSPVGRV